MHGSNPIRRQVLGDGSSLYVEETFYTIQGEGPFAGVPAVFVRLSGCWLACNFCDTGFEAGMARDPVGTTALIERVKELAGSSRRLTMLVVLTGGDPLRQNITPLVAMLAACGFHVQIETAGVQWVPGLERLLDDSSLLRMHPGLCTIVCSPKTGRVCDEIHYYAHAWKYIIRSDDVIDPEDGLPLTSTQVARKKQRLARPGSAQAVYLQPCDEGDELKNQANLRWCARLAMQHGYRVSIQQHKILQLP